MRSWIRGLVPLAVMVLSGCVTSIGIEPHMRNNSRLDDRLFRDVARAVAELRPADIPGYRQRNEIVYIEPLEPYDGTKPGSERWTVKYSSTKIVYLVRLQPDGRGGTYFGIVKVGPPDAPDAAASPGIVERVAVPQ